MAELLDVALALVERASGDEQIEAFLTHQREFEVKAYEGEAETLSSAEPRGAGVRLLAADRVGFSYTTDLTDAGLTQLVERARTNARYSTKDEAVALASPADYPQMDHLFDVDQPRVTADQKVRFAIELEAATRSFDPRIRTVEEAGYSDADSEVAIATTSGVSGSYRRTDAWCYAVAIAEDDGDTEIGFDFGLDRALSGLDADEVARRSAERALGVLGARKMPSTKLPVVFDRYTAGQFLGVIGSVLTAEAVQKGRSLFAGKLGQQVANSSLTLIDDGRAEGAPGAAPWDGEGTPTQRTVVIADGVLNSLLYDIPSARREGMNSTGNAARGGFKSAPSPGPTNMAFASTGGSRDDVLRQAGSALLVQDFHGVHSGANPVSGDFSVGVTGRLIDDGALGAPVKEITIAAPMLEILRGIVAVADDRRWLPFGGSYGGATTLVAEMTIAGT
jgi:PmbA protein